MTRSSKDRARDPDHEVIQTALDHAWAWYTMRFTQYLQLLNFTLLATAVFSAAYVAALSSGLHTVAAGIALIGCAASVAVAYTGRLIQQRADIAQAALAQIQHWLAARTGIDSLLMFAAAEASARSRPRTRQIADLAMTGAAVAWFAAAIYPMIA